MQTAFLSGNILLIICGLGILQGILLAAFIYFHPKSDHSVNKFLALYILGITAIMTMPITMELTGWKYFYIVQPINFLPGIFLYFYLLSFKKNITWKKALPHFIVPFLFIFLTYWNLKNFTALYPDAKIPTVEAMQRPSTFLISFARTTHQVIYFFLARKTLNTYQQSIQHLFSNTSRINLQWARFLVNGYLVLISTFVLIFPLILRFPDYFTTLLLLNMAVATPYIYIATVKGISQPTIWQLQSGIDKKMIEEEMQEAEAIDQQNTRPEKPKPAKSVPDDSKIGDIAKSIIGLMEKEKLYQETELTLQQLSEKLNAPSYQVSQAINEGLKKNFYDLVNGYRVEEAKRLLVNPNSTNYTILSVGFEAGFNSKTTFNTVFKKFTGQTPTEFRSQQNMSEPA